MKSRLSCLLVLAVLIFACSSPQTPQEMPLPQETLPERIAISRNTERVETSYYFEERIQIRYTEYLLPPPDYEEHTACLWLSCCSIYPPGRPVTYCINSEHEIATVITTSVSSTGNIFYIDTDCHTADSDYKQEICERGQADFNNIVEWLENRRLRE